MVYCHYRRSVSLLIYTVCTCCKRAKLLGPVVQSIVSLTSSFRGQLDKCFTTSLPNSLIVFVEKKMIEAFALRFSHIFDQNTGIFQILALEILTKRQLPTSLVLNNRALAFRLSWYAVCAVSIFPILSNVYCRKL